MSWQSILIIVAIGIADVALLGWFWIKDTFTQLDKDRPC